MKASEKYFKDIYESSGHKMKKSLDNIKKICDIFENQKVRIILSKVGHECESLFGSPKVQSIRNNPLAKKYIDLRISEQVLPIRENDIYKGNKIKDPIIRAEFNLLEDEVRTLKLENQGLKKLFEKIEIELEGGQVSFQREDNINYKDLINKLVRSLESQGCEEYRGRFCLNKDIVLGKDEWNIIKSLLN